MFSPHFKLACEIVSRAVFPEDIFEQDGDIPKVVFRKLRKVSHEDFVEPGQKAQAREVFQRLQSAWVLTEALLASNVFGKRTRKIDVAVAQSAQATSASFFVKSKKDTYSNLVLHSEGKVANVYFGLNARGTQIVVKVAGGPLCNQFLENEANHIKKIQAAFPEREKGRYLPTLLNSFSITQSGDRLMVNVFEYLQGYYTLTDVLTMFMDKKQSIDMKSAAWMYNRILEALSHSSPEGIVHGGVHPDNMLLHPESHRIVLTGWSSSVQAGEKIKYASETYKQMYPQEVIGDSSKRKAYLATDLFMAAATIWHVLGGDVTSMIEPRGIPGEVRSFLRARLTLDVRLRDAVAIQQRDRFSEVLKSLYGPAKFHPFVLPK